MHKMLHSRSGASTVSVGNLGPAEKLRLQRLARELRLTDQILSDDLEGVSIVERGGAPAWTTLEGDVISFAYSKMPHPNSRLDLAVWLGTNAHELGHVLFSPRRGSLLMQLVIEGDSTLMRGIAQVHNIIEDQRQERLVLARFAPWRAYLIAALSHHLKIEDETSWVLFTGRTWLPDDVRAQSRAAFVAAFGEPVAKMVTEIVGEYQRLADPGEGDAADAWRLLQDLHSILGSHVPPAQGCSVINGGEPDTDEASDSAPAAADEVTPDEQGDEGEQGNEGDAQGEQGDEGEQGGAQGDEGDEQGDSDSGSASKPGTPNEQLRGAASEIINSDQDAAADLDSVFDALDHGAGVETSSAPTQGTYVEPSDVARRLRVDVADALLDLKDQSEPSWVRGVDSGRLNVRRLLTGADPEIMFDRYEAGQLDAAELEIVLLLDCSGSMSKQAEQLGEATWAIRHAVDELEGRCTVIVWDSGPHTTMASADERPDERLFVPRTKGGTRPGSALSEAYSILASSVARNRLMVIMTDGDWPDFVEPEATIDALNAAGVTTVIALLGEAGRNAHRCQHAAHIGDPHRLVSLFRDVAADSIAQWL